MPIKIIPTTAQTVIHRTTMDAQGHVIDSSVEHGGNHYTVAEWTLITKINALEAKLDELLARVPK